MFHHKLNPILLCFKQTLKHFDLILLCVKPDLIMFHTFNQTLKHNKFGYLNKLTKTSAYLRWSSNWKKKLVRYRR